MKVTVSRPVAHKAAGRLLAAPSFNFQPPFDVAVGRVNQGAQSFDVEIGAWPHLHMAHTLAASLQQVGGIVQFGAKVKSHVHMSLEDIDIAKRRIFHACDGAPVMHQLSNIMAAFPHPSEPRTRNGAEFGALLVQPEVNSWLPFDRS